MGAAARIGMDVALIGADEFTARCRTSPESFTRRRKMPAGLLVESVVARKGRTLKIELGEFARERGMKEPISAPGYLKAREKLNPEALLYLAQHHAANRTTARCVACLVIRRLLPSRWQGGFRGGRTRR